MCRLRGCIYHIRPQSRFLNQPLRRHEKTEGIPSTICELILPLFSCTLRLPVSNPSISKDGLEQDRTVARQAFPVRSLGLPQFARYGMAVSAAVVATLLRLALDPLFGTEWAFILFFPTIMVSAWFGGLGPGLVTTGLTAAAADYYWMDPVGSLMLSEWGDFIALLLFTGIGVMISGLNEAWRRGAANVARSEQRLRVTLASIGDAVITTDAKGLVRRLNRVAQELTGWTQAEAEGRPLHEIFPIVNEESRLPAENPLDRVLREEVSTGLAAANHTLLLSKSGREIPIEDSAAPIRTAEGAVMGAVIVFRDASERRRAERERGKLLERERTARAKVETSESQLRLALEAGRMGTWQWTVETGEVKWSEGLEAIHGYPPGSFPGTFQAFQREIHPDDRDPVLADIAEAAEGARPHHISGSRSSFPRHPSPSSATLLGCSKSSGTSFRMR